MKLINNLNRNGLNEGRTFQMGFAFCKMIKRGEYETAHPISPCKDYLNDVVCAEMTGRDVSMYGLHYKPQDVFSKHRAHIAFEICPFRGGAPYSKFTEDSNNLKANYRNLQYFINEFERRLKINLKSVILDMGAGQYIINFSLEWLKGIYAISMFSLLMRVGQWYDGTQDVMEYLDKFNYDSQDEYLLKSALPNLKKVLENGALIQENMSKYKLSPGSVIHNNGIVAVSIEGLKGEEISEKQVNYDD